MKILIVAAEAVPFAKTGGLADVVGILPKHLARMGHDVRVVMPRYQAVERGGLVSIGDPLGVPMGIIGELWCDVLRGTLPGSEVPIYFIEHEGFYDRPSLYTDENAQGFVDNDNRFVFLSQAALQLCRRLGFEPDVVHANDWHTAIIAVLLNTTYRLDPVLEQAASVLTIHNMQHQGEYYPGLMEVLDVGWEHFNHLELECNDHVNLLKGGIYHATLWNTVSPTYASEIQTAGCGCGLEGVARDRAGALRGIINGIDYDEWNPGTDRHIAARYDVGDMPGKAVCKAALQRELGLPVRDVPLFGMVSRLVDQKGIDILAEALPRILDLDVQVALLGSGEPWAQDYFASLASVRANLGAHIGYSNPLAHRIEAGADIYLMPSRFEPCGLNQLYSLRYGTLPLVHGTGGLRDTVQSFDEETGAGTGFVLWDLNADALFDTVAWAAHTRTERRAAFDTMVERAMRQRFSWEGSAREYVRMYADAVALRGRLRPTS